MKKRIIKKHINLVWRATTDWDEIKASLEWAEDNGYDTRDVYDYRAFGHVGKPVRGRRMIRLMHWLQDLQSRGYIDWRDDMLWRYYSTERTMKRDRLYALWREHSFSDISATFSIRRYRSPVEERRLAVFAGIDYKNRVAPMRREPREYSARPEPEEAAI